MKKHKKNEKVKKKKWSVAPLGFCTHVVYCGIGKAVDGMHFVRDFIGIGEQAHLDHNSILSDWH